MRRLDFQELDARSAEFDGAALISPRIDRFCSSTDWILPFQAAFAPDAEPVILELSGGFVALMAVRGERGAPILVPLESGWGLACPLVGPEPLALVATLTRLLETGEIPWEGLVLSGAEDGGLVHTALVQAFSGRHPILRGPTCGRRVASLEGGEDGFLSRRSPAFRASLRRTRRRAAREGLALEYIREATPEQARALHDRVLGVEGRSWKGASGHGIDHGPTLPFYREMMRRLAARGALRVLFASRDGEDVAYVFGGLLGETYRGLQVSFDARFAAESLGNLVQVEMIARLCQEGIRGYDLGTEMAYKHHWAEPGLDTVTLYVLRRPRR